MFKKLAITIGTIGLLSGIFGCNSDSSSEIYTESILSSSTQVTDFYLSQDDSVLVSLDSVFFSIDLKTAQIFNADSLPYGTRINRLVPKITYTAASRAEISFPRPGQTDSVINYLTNSTDSVDFSYGPVKFLIVSGNGEAERTYTIKVNVHKMKPDSLCWTDMAYSTLPTNLSTPDTQRAIRLDSKAYCLTAAAGSYCMASTSTPVDKDSWDKSTVAFGFAPDVNTLAATSNAMYILSTDGDLYTSADGLSWTATGETWSNIIGGYGTTLLGLKSDGGIYKHVTYPASTETTVKAGFPVKDASQPVTFDTQWGDNPQLYILGGIDADGNYVDSTWGYDGKVWIKISTTPLPSGMAGITLFPYQSFITNTLNWSVTGYQVLIALGGRTDTGKMNGKSYISYNMGLTWRECSTLMQLPDGFPLVSDAQALVFESTLHSRSGNSDGWITFPSRKLPPYYTLVKSNTASRAVRPIESWECPFIYLFGGYDEAGKLQTNVWRGVLNRLTFKPLQ